MYGLELLGMTLSLFFLASNSLLGSFEKDIGVDAILRDPAFALKFSNWGLFSSYTLNLLIAEE